MSASRQERRYSSLGEHQLHRKTLTPPLMGLLNLEPHVDWRKKRVPDMIWLSTMVDVHAGDWQAAHRALEALVPQLGQALSFFPDCPAAWLYEDWAFEVNDYVASADAEDVPALSRQNLVPARSDATAPGRARLCRSRPDSAHRMSAFTTPTSSVA